MRYVQSSRWTPVLHRPIFTILALFADTDDINMRYFQNCYARVFRRMVVRGVRVFHLIMTTANEIYVLAPNDTIFEVPTFGNDVYLPGISRGSRASLNTLYTATFTTEDTRD